MSVCGSPALSGTNRLASSSVSTRTSAAVYRVRNAGPRRGGASGVITNLGPVLVGLPQADRPQQALRKVRADPLPEGQGQVLGGRDTSLQPRHIGIQVAVVDVLDDPPADDIRKLLQVHDVAGRLLDLAGHHNLEDVVVPVQIRALPEDTLILVSGHGRVAQLVGGIERFAATPQHGRRAGPWLSVGDGRTRIYQILRDHNNRPKS